MGRHVQTTDLPKHGRVTIDSDIRAALGIKGEVEHVQITVRKVGEDKSVGHATCRVDERGRMTIPDDVRDAVGITHGDTIELDVRL